MVNIYSCIKITAIEKFRILKITKFSSDNLSRFRTLNTALHYCKAQTPDDASKAFNYAKEHSLNAFVLGAGSNVFFKNRQIKSLVIKNDLPKYIRKLEEGKVEVSSSSTMMSFLKFALDNGYDAPYYLASAPCEIGGAIAMNAGTGPSEKKYISDYLESVRFLENGKILEKKKSELRFGHRNSEFLEKDRNIFIISAIFNLPQKIYKSNPISARLKWAEENQDLRSNNCGSLCNKYSAPIMRFARAVFCIAPAGLSSKKLNWAVNNSPNPFWLRLFLTTLRFLHFAFNKKLKFEIRIVD